MVRGPETTTDQVGDAAIAVARQMASCAVTRKPKAVVETLAAKDLASYKVALGKLSPTLSDCSVRSAAEELRSQRLGMSNAMLVGVLSEAELRRTGNWNVPADGNRVAPDVAGYLYSRADQRVVAETASCLAHVEPGRSAVLVASDPGSAGEAKAFAALLPAIGGCLERNVTLTASRPVLRLAMATALYRRSLEPARAIQPVIEGQRAPGR